MKERPTETIDWQLELDVDTFYEWCQQKVPQIVRGRSAGQAGTSQRSASSMFAANVKLDVKAYPVWNGELGGWAGFNRATTSLAASHKLSRVLISPDKWVEPNPGTDDAELFTQQNTFMYSVWANRITGGNASTTVKQFEIAKDGRNSYLAIKSWYESEANLQTVAMTATKNLNNLKLHYQKAGGADAYIKQFREYVLDLETCDQPLTETQKKTYLLNGITDRDYVNTVDNLKESVKPYEECLLSIINKYNSLYPSGTSPAKAKPRRGNNAQGRGSSQGRGRGGRGRGRGRGGRGGGNNQAKANNSDYIAPEAWNKLSKEQKDSIMATRKARKTGGAVDGAPLPNQYSAARSGYVIVSMPEQEAMSQGYRDPNAGALVVPNSGASVMSNVTNDMTMRQFMRSSTTPNASANSLTDQELATMRNIMNRHANVMKRMVARVNNTVTSNGQEYTEVIADDGADTCMVAGSCWHTLSTTSRSVTVQGINGSADENLLHNKPIGSAAAVYENPATGETHLIILNEAVLMGDDPNLCSLISSNQVRSFGHKLDNVAKRFGGEQAINTVDGAVLPLEYKNALMTLKVRKPSREELRDLIAIELTRDSPWDPENESDDNEWMMDDYEDAIQDSWALVGSTTRRAAPTVTKEEPDWTWMRECLAWKPLEVVKKTFEHTTQLAKNVLRLPMRQHFKSRFPGLNRRRLNETYSTDTLFASIPSIGGQTCAQIFVGKQSQFTALYGMRSESSGVQALEDFIRFFGAPNMLLNDNSQMQTGNAWTEVCRMYNIAQATIEAHQAHMNPAERRIQEVKKTTNVLLDRTGSPDELWLLCAMYVVFLLNHLSHKILDYRTPLEVAFGETPDISSLLSFRWYDDVFYLDADETFPHSKEKPGKFVGIAENCGDAMTYLILTEDTKQVIARSVVRRADNPFAPNARSAPLAGEEVKTVVKSPTDEKGPTTMTLPTVAPDDLIGYTYIQNVDGEPTRAEVKSMTGDDDNMFVVKVGDREEIIAYNDIINHVQDNLGEDDTDRAWIFQDVIDHRKKANSYEVLVEWDGGSTSWEPLSHMASQDPVTLARYAKDNELLDEPGWKRFKQIARRDKRYIRMLRQANLAKDKKAEKYKFGVKVPRTAKEALKLDELNGNSLWQRAMKAEIDSIQEFGTFRNLGVGARPPPGHRYIPCHMVFDVKYDLRRKARLVAGGHTTPDSTESAYSGVVSTRGVRTLIFLAELNEMELVAADVSNAYLLADTREQLYYTAGAEFGELAGSTLVMVKALYGTKTAGARWNETLSDTLRELGWKMSKAEPDIWMKENEDHYEYLGVFVDDLIIASYRAMTLVKDIEQRYKLKGVGMPKYYLGADIDRITEPENVLVMGAKTYIKKAVEQIETLMKMTLPTRPTSPLEAGDHPELDETEFLDSEGISIYMTLVGMANWAVTLGRFDIAFAVSTMGRFRIAPRKGHLDRLLRIFGYLKNYINTGIKFRTDMADVEGEIEVPYDWERLYPGAHEELPPDMPTPKGKPVRITTFVDADHAHDTETRRSVTGILHLLNKTPIDWYSKRQNTVETSTYGSEFVAARLATEQIMDMRYCLRMLGVPMEGPAWLFGDNMSVITSSTLPASTLKKKHLSICYHRTREAIAANIIVMKYIKSENNPSDVLTKSLPHRILFPLMKPFLFWDNVG